MMVRTVYKRQEREQKLDKKTKGKKETSHVLRRDWDVDDEMIERANFTEEKKKQPRRQSNKRN